MLVTDLRHELLTMAQLYRERADAENTFDELKNQWGWAVSPLRIWLLQTLGAGGGTDLQLVELICATRKSKARLEAITSRPFSRVQRMF